ncbi:uncharacterized protein SRS1_16179 [Sporisorium reilianum f. sp. reilianum]|uniref:Uncharacterized protein n=1 Tax=Sporisorium reilianum f. sp. reilianum TaxID=72559 RepID=A0A2N8ULE6_9BASI|nr:uncharacterized protein SRS1_16179 [Sporisorium reilianum f. sp. reilianum]
MSFAPTTPITASGSAAEYTHKFKKHFGDRPTAFALSASAHSTANSSEQGSSSGTLLPAGAAAVERGGDVDDETHTALANLGWRIRARVNQGYLRTASTANAFASERDILRNVTNTRRAWSRTATAPTIAGTFEELSTGTPAHPAPSAKRGRRLSDAQDADQEEQEMQVEPQQHARRIAGLPKLSFSSSVSSTDSHDAGFPTSPPQPRSFARHSSSHSPFQSSSYTVTDMDTDMDDVVAKREIGGVRFFEPLQPH